MAQSELETANAALVKAGEERISSLSAGTKTSITLTERGPICRRALLRMHPWNFACKRTVLEPAWVAITGAQSGTGGVIKILTASTSGIVSGGRVTIHEIEGTTEANGTFVVQNLVANTSFELASTTFSNAWTSGGEWTLAAAFDYTYSIDLPSDCLRVLRVQDYQCDPDWRVESNRLLTNDSTVYLKYIYEVTDYTEMPIDFYECLALYIAVDLVLHINGSDARRDLLSREFKMALAKARHNDATEDPAEKLEASDWINSRVRPATFGHDRSYYGRYA